MSWISQIMIAVALTVLTGCIAFGILLVLQGRLNKRNPESLFVMLRLSCLFCVIPFGYLILGLVYRKGYIQTANAWQVHFKVTGSMWAVYVMLTFAWILMFLYTLSRNGEKLKEWILLMRANIPEEDPAAEEELLRVKRALRIRRRVHLYRNDSLNSPMITGFFVKKVILPYVEFDRKSYEIIFYHELMHCKSHDIFYRYCILFVNFVMPMHVVSERLEKKLQEWSEYHCDARVVEILPVEHPQKAYFNGIIEIMNRASGEKQNLLFPTLYEDRTELDRRIDFMIDYKKMKHMTKKATFLLAAAFVLTNLTTTYAASTGVATAHDMAYLQTEDKAVIGGKLFDENDMTFVPGGSEKEDFKIEYATPEDKPLLRALKPGTVKTDTWTVTAGVRMMSTSFKVTNGQTISFSVTPSPNNVHYWFGVMRESNGDMYYADMPNGGASGINFSVPATDRYRTFVHNKGSKTITAGVSYMFQ